MKSSDRLLSFYKWWAGERDLVKLDPSPFLGLCGNLLRFGDALSYSDCDDLLLRTFEEMRQQFDQAGLDYKYPFNCGKTGFMEETWINACLTNPSRIQWVQDRINEAED